MATAKPQPELGKVKSASADADEDEKGTDFGDTLRQLWSFDFSSLEDDPCDTGVLQKALTSFTENWVAESILSMIDPQNSGVVSAAQFRKWQQENDELQLKVKLAAIQRDRGSVEHKEVNEKDTGDEDVNEVSPSILNFALWREFQQKKFWKKKQKQEAVARQLEAKESRKHRDKWTDQFDLTGGLGLQPEAQDLYDYNWRPLAFVLVNMLLLVPCMYQRHPFWNLPGIVLNAVILLIGVLAEASFNAAEVFCGEFGRDWLRYDPSRHFSVLDAWFNIEEFVDISEGLTLDDDNVECAQSEEEDEVHSEQIALMISTRDVLHRRTTLMDSAQRAFEKAKEHVAECQIVPPPFSYYACLGFLITNVVLGASNAFFYTNFISSYKYRKNHSLEISWRMYCIDDDFNTRPARRNGECLVRFSAWMSLLSVAIWSLLAAFILLRNVKRTPLLWMRAAKEELLENFAGDLQSPKPSARKLVNAIELRVVRAKANGSGTFYWKVPLTKRILPIPYVPMACFILSCLVILGAFFVKPSYLFGVRTKYWFTYLIFAVAMAQSVYSLTYVLIILHRIYAFYLEAYEVMVGLSKPINVQCIEDLVIWWETRKFYQNYNNPVLYIFGATSIIFLTVSCTVAILVITMNLLFSSLATSQRRYLKSPTNALVSCFLVIFTGALLYVLNLVVSIEFVQRQHSDMLREEKVRLDAVGAIYTHQIEEQKVADTLRARVELTATHCAAGGKTATLLTGAGAKHLDMAKERAVASVGKESHRLIESMLYIIDNRDKYPDVFGVQVTQAKLIAFATYLGASVASVFAKAVATS